MELFQILGNASIVALLSMLVTIFPLGAINVLRGIWMSEGPWIGGSSPSVQRNRWCRCFWRSDA